MVYNGTENPQVLESIVTDLVAERFYRFRVCAVDVNGLGVYSAESSIQACIPPSEIGRPIIDSITSTSFTVQWAVP